MRQSRNSFIGRYPARFVGSIFPRPLGRDTAHNNGSRVKTDHKTVNTQTLCRLTRYPFKSRRPRFARQFARIKRLVTFHDVSQ
jgi:hypothetical protein